MIVSDLSTETVRDFQTRYDAILKQAGKDNRKPGQRGKVRCLIDRLTAHRNEAFLFLEDFSVPFANNRGEQSFRMAKRLYANFIRR